MRPTPDHLDALTAAPHHHRLLLENESVRILETRIEPGDTTPLHTHCWPAANYIISWDHIVRRDERGDVTLDTRKTPLNIHPGQATWLPRLEPHTLENVGTAVIHVVSVEVKGG